MARRALIALIVLAFAPSSAAAKHSSCAAPGSRTVQSDDAVRVYARHGHTWACAFATGRRFELGKGSEFFRDGVYSLEHVQLVGTKVAYVVSQDGVDYTVSQVWLRDVRQGRFLLKGVSPVVRESVCTPGDDRNLDSLVLAPKGHVAWGTTYSCAPGLASYREQIVAFKPGGRPRLLDSAADADTRGIETNSLGLGEVRTLAYWLKDGSARSATF
jgi:hypothetical protein